MSDRSRLTTSIYLGVLCLIGVLCLAWPVLLAVVPPPYQQMCLGDNTDTDQLLTWYAVGQGNRDAATTPTLRWIAANNELYFDGNNGLWRWDAMKSDTTVRAGTGYYLGNGTAAASVSSTIDIDASDPFVGYNQPSDALVLYTGHIGGAAPVLAGGLVVDIGTDGGNKTPFTTPYVSGTTELTMESGSGWRWVLENPELDTFSAHAGVVDCTGGDFVFQADNCGLDLGAGGDSTLYYDGSDLRIEPRVVGVGNVTTAVGAHVADWFVADFCADTASAATVAAEACEWVTFTGTTTIDTVNTCNAANKGRRLGVLCGTDATPFGDSTGNLLLAGAFTCSTGDVLSLVCDGANWREMARSVN